MSLVLSQEGVADAVKIPRSTYSLIERAKLERVSVHLAAEIAAVLGLDLFLGIYPAGNGLRDEASANLIRHVAQQIGSPLRYRTEVLLPRSGVHQELRRWDLVTYGSRKRSAFEFETRLYDAQAQTGRINAKRRDDPVDQFLLVLADTRHNRRTLAEFPDLFSDLPRLRTATVLNNLEAGQHPPTGLLLLRVPPKPKPA